MILAPESTTKDSTRYFHINKIAKHNKTNNKQYFDVHRLGTGIDVFEVNRSKNNKQIKQITKFKEQINPK